MLGMLGVLSIGDCRGAFAFAVVTECEQNVAREFGPVGEPVGIAGVPGANAALARGLIAAGGPASLATLGADGYPFASYVITAPAHDGAPLTLLSRLARHSGNLARDPRASLLFVREPEEGSESLTAERLTLTGRCLKHDDLDSRRRFLERHPDAERYSGFADFSLYRFEIAASHLVAGFGRIVDLTAKELIGG
jgi:putative heme iron utilization protein